MFVVSLTKLVSSRPRDSSETFLLGKLVGHHAQSSRSALPSRKVSDESLGRDETSFVRLPTNIVFSQVTVNFLVNNYIAASKSIIANKSIFY